MILPYARIVVLLRRPEERFLSNLRMELCRAGGGGGTGINSRAGDEGGGGLGSGLEEYLVNEGFHRPGQLVRYLDLHKFTTLPQVTSWCNVDPPSWTSLWSCMALRCSMMPLTRGGPRLL